MRKPLFLMPFIIVYRIVFGLLKFPIYICKYFYVGLKTITKLIIFIFVKACWLLYQIPKSIVMLFANKKHNEEDVDIASQNDNDIVLTNDVSNIVLEETEPVADVNVEPQEEQLVETVEQVEIADNSISEVINNSVINVENIEFDPKEFERLRKLKTKEIKRLETEYNRKHNISVEKQNKKTKEKDVYINDQIENKQSVLGSNISSMLEQIGNLPKRIKNKINNNNFIKHSRNKDLIKKEALLINFDGVDAEKSDVKVLYEYVAKNPEGKVVKDYFEAFSKVEVHSFLLSEGFEVYSIRTNKWIQFMYKKANTNTTKFKTKDLPFFLTQLSTYIKAGIPLVDALRILERQYKNKSYKRILKAVIYDLTMGENLSTALAKQNVAFPKLLINMVKTAEMTGELPEVLDDQSKYYDQTEKIRKQMVSAMMYPSIVLVASIGVSVFIMLYVIPQFVDIYESMDPSKIPQFTLTVLAISEFLKKNILLLAIAVIIFVLIFIWSYKNIRAFRTICQWLAMKFPIIGNSLIYNEVAMFTKTFSSLLSHNVFITESMEVLNKITNNEIYKMIILDTITNLAKGDKISEAFKDNWAFPLPAYEMLVTGEKTGELPEMMGKVADYYQTLHAESVARIKTVVEPMITIFLTVIVGVLIMAIIVPMFSMYETVQGM